MRRLLIVGCLLLLCISGIAFLGIRLASSASSPPQATATRPQGSIPSLTATITAQATANATSADSGQLICARPAIEWASLRSEAPADVLAAAECTAMFQSARHSNDPISSALNTGTIGTPALVKPYVDGTPSATVWLIPVVGPSGYPTALLEFVYDQPNHRLRAGSFMAVGNNMFYTSRTFPYISAPQATSLVRQSRHVALMAGRSPELVYFFGPDHAAVITGTAQPWTYGGDVDIDPMWRVPGADGRWYYVTPHDLRVRVASDFPISAGNPPMPQFVR